jgi:hypothetical protein
VASAEANLRVIVAHGWLRGEGKGGKSYARLLRCFVHAQRQLLPVQVNARKEASRAHGGDATRQSHGDGAGAGSRGRGGGGGGGGEAFGGSTLRLLSALRRRVTLRRLRAAVLGVLAALVVAAPAAPAAAAARQLLLRRHPLAGGQLHVHRLPALPGVDSVCVRRRGLRGAVKRAQRDQPAVQVHLGQEAPALAGLRAREHAPRERLARVRQRLLHLRHVQVVLLQRLGLQVGRRAQGHPCAAGRQHLQRLAALARHQRALVHARGVRR